MPLDVSSGHRRPGGPVAPSQPCPALTAGGGPRRGRSGAGVTSSTSKARSASRTGCRRGPFPALPGAHGGGEPAVVAKRRRDYFKHVEGQLSFEDLLKLAEQQEGEQDGEQVRSDGPQPLGTVAAAAVREDQQIGKEW